MTLEQKTQANELSNVVIGAAIEVHRELGPGLLESAYEMCLARELSLRGIAVRRQVQLPITYKGLSLDTGLKIDLLVEELLIVELKTVDAFHPIHEAQLLTYLRMSRLWLGLLINFNVPYLRDGIKRIVHG